MKRSMPIVLWAMGEEGRQKKIRLMLVASLFSPSSNVLILSTHPETPFFSDSRKACGMRRRKLSDSMEFIYTQTGIKLMI